MQNEPPLIHENLHTKMFFISVAHPYFSLAEEKTKIEPLES